MIADFKDWEQKKDGVIFNQIDLEISENLGIERNDERVPEYDLSGTALNEL